MAEFNFYCIWDDSLAFLNDLIHLNRFTFVVVMGYSTNEICQFTSLSDKAHECLNKRPHLYLWSEEYSRFPPRLEEPTFSGFWFLDMFGSGPFLELYIPKGEENEEITEIGHGFLRYQPYFCYPGTNVTYKPPETLKYAFRDLQKLLSKHMGRRYMKHVVYTHNWVRKIKVDTFWIGLNALNLIDEEKGGIQWGYDKVWYTKKNLMKTRRELEPLDIKFSV